MPRTGRKRTTGNGSNTKTYKRVAVPYPLKLRVRRFLDGHSMEKTIERFYPGLVRAHVRSKKRLRYSWKASRLIEAMYAAGLGRHRRHGSHGMGAILPTVAEEQLVSHWTPSWGFHSVVVMEEAFPTTPQTGNPSQNAGGTDNPAGRKRELVEFSRQVQAKMEELNITQVDNADQTGK
ncbi:hypothetical protein PR003_g7147 [Phytophthora rubi]|uniref:Uncharacterized protein n=1 Tax=Phytophthora rubi TaxID=129364 RepID=A0A6A3N4D3_9STRA|nr:hypothetical protein PR001_g7919 [Phytophthora rubi]KAE9347004.1 hypothetical protein PR003_g7147 [Phytophthora rubi]